MQSKLVWLDRAVLLTILAILVVSPVRAGKPSGVGGDNKHQGGDFRGGNKHEVRDNPGEGKRREHENDRGGRHFDGRQYVIVHEYYLAKHRAGHCPPGLAKKNNGCMPPGQARKWHKGRYLPRDVVFYNLPSRLLAQLGAPPSGHRYVRVASDILLITIGMGMVIDSIDDLARM